MNREEIKEAIKRSIKCTDYLEKSRNNLYCCPVCNSGHGQNGTGAVKYYPDTNTWTCHACGAGHDVIDAYTMTTGTDYNTALSFLAANLGLTTDRQWTAAGEEKNDRAERPQTNANAGGVENNSLQHKSPQNAAERVTEQITDFSAYYAACSSRINDPAAVSYLQARGISTETALRFNLGFDPQADPAAAPGATGDEYKAHPTPRIIAPCTNDFYIARSIDPNTPAAYKAPNPKGTHTQLFRAAADGAGIVFITEGVFDALSFAEVGQAAIATNGKGNGKLLLNYLQKNQAQMQFIICPDNDDDTKTAEQAAALNASLQGMNYKSIVYNVAGQYHDANDALKADRATFEKNIAAAIRELQRDDITDFLEKITTDAYKPFKTGLNFFDNLLSGGIIQQSLLLLMAAPGTGKTTLAQQIAETMAREKKPVIYFNFEMSKEQMLAKAISAKLYRCGGSKSTTGILQGYNWTDAEREEIESVIEEYRRENYPYIKYNPAGISGDLDDLMTYLKATGEKAKAQGQQAPAAVIDYLHLITSRERLEPQELIKRAVTGLKQYAAKYNTFVIAIIATNRASNKGGKMTMESGRDSSNLEYTADYQLSLNYYAIDNGKVTPDDTDKIAELQQAARREMILRVHKNRFAVPGKSEKVLFDAAHNIFYGTCDDFIPAAGFELCHGRTAFDDDEPQTMLRI